MPSGRTDEQYKLNAGPGLILYSVEQTSSDSVDKVEQGIRITRTLLKLASEAEQAGEKDVEATVEEGLLEEVAVGA